MVNAGLFTFDMPRAFLDLLAGFMTGIYRLSARIMVADAGKVWGTDSFWQFEGEVWWL